MITTHFYLDARRVAAGVPAPLRISIASRGTRALIPLSVTLLPSQWDALKQIVVAHPCRQQLNSMLAEQKCEIDAVLFRLSAAGELQGLNAAGIKQRVLAVIRPEESYVKSGTAFLPRFDAYASRLSPGAARIYGFTRSRLARYLGDGLGALTFEDMGVDWLHGFDEFLSHTAPSRNSRNIHFRNIRAVFNDALDDEVITCYPFRRFRLKYEPTRKRSLSVDRLRSLFSAEVEDWERRYLDCFKLIFCLCGINIVDLCRLEAVTDGRVEYVRAKTHRLYSIKVEPEAQEIIGRYRGRAHLLCYDDNGTTYRYFYNRLREGLNRIGERLGIHGLSTYWARHTWATIAASLDIPKETIAAALGHGGNSVTDIYIDFDRSKIDDANRRVLDWVLYGKR